MQSELRQPTPVSLSAAPPTKARVKYYGDVLFPALPHHFLQAALVHKTYYQPRLGASLYTICNTIWEMSFATLWVYPTHSCWYICVISHILAFLLVYMSISHISHIFMLMYRGICHTWNGCNNSEIRTGYNHLYTVLNKAIRDGKYLALPDASAWKHSTN